MVLHLIKLSVGSESIESMTRWQAGLVAAQKAAGLPPLPFHDTRMFPKRAQEILAGGSMYWVIKRKIRCRQKIIALDRLDDDQGKSFCRIILDPEIVPTEQRVKRPFQGWRYLEASSIPRDTGGSAFDSGVLSHGLEQALKDACVW